MRTLVVKFGMVIVIFVASFIAGFCLGMVVAGSTNWECTPEAECNK